MARVDQDAQGIDHLWVDWQEYHDLIERLAILIDRSGWQFDHVLCLARGGMRVGDVLSRVFDRPLAILSTSSYRASAGTEQGSLDIAENITMTQGKLSGRVLLVDDLVDSGVTMKAVCEQLRVRYPELSEVRSAVLWQKARSAFSADYTAVILDTDPWIHQPFERYDGQGLAPLIERHGNA
jgi:hypoxanthine phosphoribosyltransferase